MSTSTITCSFKWKQVWLSAIMMLVSINIFAQQQITGVIRNAANAPLENVSVSVKGTSRGTTTDARGAFSIQARENETLVVSFVGFGMQEVKVGRQTNINNITITENSNELEGVVVTALGISRAARSLGYSVDTIKGEQLTEAMSANWTDALSGKVAGLNMVRSGSGPTASNKIILRGENNLTGENEALIVVDGVVINQGSGRRSAISGETVYGTGSDNMPADYGSSVNDLNREDIESVTVWDNQPLFSSYSQAIEKCGLPFFQVIGNHDMDYEKGGDEKSDDTFKKTYGPSYYSFNRGQVHYVVLDDVYYLGSDRNYKGFITEDQLAWLKKDLSFVTPDKLIVLCTHIPVHNSVENKQALYDILKPYKAHIMSGHTHYNMNVINGNVYEHVHGTVCGAWWTGPICGDGTPPGYAIYEVNGTELTWYYKTVGKTKAHQIRTMVESKSTGDQLVANVWNWDPTWKVEWQVDGTSKGALTRATDYDPLAVALYLGDQLPASRTFVEPNKTEHLFKATIPKGAQQVKIIATDRFGNRYEAIA